MTLVTYYSVIGNEATYRIALLISRYALSVQEIAAAVKLAQPHVSHKLARLRQYGYARNHRVGRRVFYRFNEPWRSILLHGDLMWHRLNPELPLEGRGDLTRLRAVLGTELATREIHPAITGPPSFTTVSAGSSRKQPKK
jgi:DNA-binding transcriptional ArsR family regulator